MTRNPIIVGTLVLALCVVMGVFVLVDPGAQWSDTTRRFGTPIWLLLPLGVAIGGWLLFKGLKKRRWE